MSIEVLLTLHYDDYASYDDSVRIATSLTEREAQIALSVLYFIDNPQAWIATQSEYDSIDATIASLMEALESV